MPNEKVINDYANYTVPFYGQVDFVVKRFRDFLNLLFLIF